MNLKGGNWVENRFRENHQDFPLVSIVTVTYNAEKHLAQAIDSILNQTYKNIELIIIDGGSSDSTLQIIKQREGQIDFWISEADNGIYDAMNKGLTIARGEWICFKNADDWFLPSAIETLIDHTKKIDADIFYGNSLSVINEKPLVVAPYFTDHRNLGQNPSIDHRSAFFRLKIHKKTPFNTRYKLAADFDVYWQFKNLGAKFYHLESFISYKRFGGASDGTKVLEESFAINKQYVGIFFAHYSKLKSVIQFLMWKNGTIILKAILGDKKFQKFKQRKL